MKLKKIISCLTTCILFLLYFGNFITGATNTSYSNYTISRITYKTYLDICWEENLRPCGVFHSIQVTATAELIGNTIHFIYTSDEDYVITDELIKNSEKPKNANSLYTFNPKPYFQYLGLCGSIGDSGGTWDKGILCGNHNGGIYCTPAYMWNDFRENGGYWANLPVGYSVGDTVFECSYTVEGMNVFGAYIGQADTIIYNEGVNIFSNVVGDTNGDGKVSIADSIILNRYLAGTVDSLPCSDPPPLAPEDDSTLED